MYHNKSPDVFFVRSVSSACLTPREVRVLRVRFGIGMNTNHTLAEVGQQFNVTREDCRQIEAKALQKPNHPSRSLKMRSPQRLSRSGGGHLRWCR